MAAAQIRKDKIVDELRQGIKAILDAAKVELITGQAEITKDAQLIVDGKVCEAKRIIIATGSSWSYPSGLVPDGKMILSSDDMLCLDKTPKTLLIVGGGVIGVEFASIFSAFGSKITIVEATKSILPNVETTISRLLANSFKGRGIEILTDTTVERADVNGPQVDIHLTNGAHKQFERVLVCTGRRPNPPFPPLEKGGPPHCRRTSEGGFELTDRGAIRVNEKFETSIPNIFAVGDVIGGPMLAHLASAQAVSCISKIFGDDKGPDLKVVPLPIFSIPEIASVGMTSDELKGHKISFRTGRFPYAASGKALCDGEREGMAIVHVDEGGVILGAHFFGANATILVAEAALAVRLHLTADDIGQTIHAHPTFSEVFQEAAMDAIGGATHKVYKC